MAKKDPYVEFLKEDFNDLFGQMELTPIQRKFLASRWLDQVLWMEKKANQCRDRHYRLRLSAIILGVIVPILIGINPGNPKVAKALQYATISLSAIVAVSAAVEEFFHYGERWYHYRRTVESLKTYGWQFSQLSGRYAKYPNHTTAFQDFANQVEEVIQRDVEIYVTQVAKNEEDSTQTPVLVTGPLPDIDDLSGSSGDDDPSLP
ncbi:DUF4231 domain-containing protein [Leptolyngbya iicbica]|uniref:DUF4231 domain-containing protein n=2 Tax=Cyanophyceae TaxID=3028117 RepID=A0A4Q7E301_9CYAN|nr:DUF4231 domain-containing protein [Leptolyngbya sp. LK]RZM75440.1 DUF4231 domain-containing protein [Leptolyngbya sp. LK]